MLLVALVACATSARFGKATCDGSTGTDRDPGLARISGVKCHSAHRFSRRAQWQRYRNLIKTRSSRRTRRTVTLDIAEDRQSPQPAPQRRALLACRDDSVEADALACLMKSYISGPRLHLVFKWRFGHLAGAAAGRGRAICEITPCRCSQNIVIPRELGDRLRDARCRDGRADVGSHRRGVPALSVDGTDARRPRGSSD